MPIIIQDICAVSVPIVVSVASVADITNEFATAAYRFGHSMVQPVLFRLKKNGAPIPEGHQSLRETFFTRSELNPNVGKGIEPLLRGLALVPSQKVDRQVVDDIRNFLFGDPAAGGVDLAALNILFRNEGDGTFTRVTSSAGDLNAYGAWMGFGVGDYDNDGFLDLFSSNISDLRITRDPALPPLVVPPPSTWDNPRPTLFHNNGDGTFSDVEVTAFNSQAEQLSWGCTFGDFNSDGNLDFYNAMNLAPVGVIGREPQGARLFSGTPGRRTESRT